MKKRIVALLLTSTLLLPANICYAGSAVGGGGQLLIGGVPLNNNGVPADQVAMDENEEDNSFYDRTVVRYVQQALNKLGYDCGTPDGVAGSNTEKQIIQYKTDKKLSNTDEKIDKVLLESIGLRGLNEIVKYSTSVSYSDMMADNENASNHRAIKFSGTVLQVMDGEIRVTVDGNSDHFVLCGIISINLDEDIKEGDSVTIYGTYLGLTDYIAVLGNIVTVPHFSANYLETKNGIQLNS